MTALNNIEDTFGTPAKTVKSSEFLSDRHWRPNSGIKLNIIIRGVSEGTKTKAGVCITELRRRGKD